MIIIVDASALVALTICDSLNVLKLLFSEVKVSQTVFEEVTVSGKPGSDKLTSYLQNKVEQLNLNHWVIDGNSLGNGELTSIALYKYLKADYLLIDDKAGRRVAKLNNIKVIGSLGVLIAAKRKGIIKLIKPHIEILKTSKIYFSTTLLEHALKITNEIDAKR
jgi:predicted nucleic acid-binding protein